MGMVVWGAVGSSQVIWGTANFCMGLMATVNLIAIILLAKPGFLMIKDYEKQIKERKTPVFNPEIIPEKFRDGISPGIWNENIENQ